jgi:hypothetical protein
MNRKTGSPQLPENVTLPLFADALDRLVNNFLGQRTSSAVKHPDALLLVHACFASGRTQNDPVFRTFQLEGITGGQLQLIAHGFGEHDPPRFVHGKCGKHNGILP